MARPKNALPTYRHHKSTDTARCWVGGRWVNLGPYDSPESRQRFARIVAELAGGATPAHAQAAQRSPSGPGIDEVLLAFLKHAEQHYRRPDGTPTQELVEYRQTFIPVRELYGLTPAAEFGPLALKAVRQRMIGAGLCRTTINNRVRRIKHIFKWAGGEELVPAAVHQSLLCVQGLQKGRSAAPEPQPVLPVAEHHVRATLPYLRRHIQVMIELQLLTGMRPGEVVRMRPADVDRSGDVWFYRPGRHKNQHRGKSRAVALGPRCQALLADFAPIDPAGYYFSPRRAVDQFHADRTQARRTDRYPSHMRRNASKRARNPRRSPREHYDVMTYDRAVARGVERVGRAYTEAGVDVDLHIPPWSPNQIRHAVAAGLREEYDLEHVRAVLGHSYAVMSDHYSRSADQSLAAKVAARRS